MNSFNKEIEENERDLNHFEDYDYDEELYDLPKATNLMFMQRRGDYWYFSNTFHGEHVEIAADMVSNRILYDNRFLAKALKDKDLEYWLNTNNYILRLFLQAVGMGMKYNPKEFYQNEE